MAVAAPMQSAQAESARERPVRLNRVTIDVRAGCRLHPEGYLAICKLRSNTQFGPDRSANFGVYSRPGRKNQPLDLHILVE